MNNPFEILRLPAQIDLSREELEERYLELSRQHHPDANPGTAPSDQVAVLQRSAAINDAYRALRNRWSRAEALIDLAAPAAMAKTKTLCPMFLMEAMEIREQVLEDPPESLAALAADIEHRIDSLFAAVAKHLANGQPREAATLLHQSNYYRKALKDLQGRLEAAS